MSFKDDLKDFAKDALKTFMYTGAGVLALYGLSKGCDAITPPPQPVDITPGIPNNARVEVWTPGYNDLIFTVWDTDKHRMVKFIDTEFNGTLDKVIIIGSQDYATTNPEELKQWNPDYLSARERLSK